MTAAGRSTRPPRRLCPACGIAASVKESEQLWPLDWRCGACGFSPPISQGFVLLAPEYDEVDEGFDLRNFEILEAVESDHFWFVSRNELIRWLVRSFASDATRVLEIGCGTGFVLSALQAALPGARIAGSEIHSRGLVTARLRHGSSIELIQMDARKAFLADALDLVGAFDVLEHIAEDGTALREICRMLKPGGILIATVPQHPWMWSTTDDLAHHERRYRVGELARKASAAGLEPLYRSSFLTLAFPLMAASRAAARLRPSPRSLEEQARAEYAMSPATARVMLGVNRLEHLLRRLGAPLPFGGSQILVARRPSDR